MKYSLFSALCFAALSRSTPVKPTKSCKEYTIPLKVISENLKWALGEFESNEDMVEFSAASGRRDASTTFHPFTLPTLSETAIYTISGTYCEPVGEGDGTVILATHGAGYDRNYVDYAISQGHSIFYYDRLGTGKSDIISGYVAQISMQASILAELIPLVRSGKFSSPPSKLVLLGHSLGSVVSNTVLNSHPEMVDATILTGIAYNTSSTIPNQAKQLRLAKLQNPTKWETLDGYAVWMHIYSNNQDFFKVPYYERDVVQYAQDNQAPAALLENLSIRTSNVSSPGFTGPVMLNATGSFQGIDNFLSENVI
ncbi:uncharacterized protein A1O9_10728 [Exophiala aquamarina CBS 119918]|uniref:Serine aminopeptidase S33 domain-containing protein n=1 Tax=Exophiala aquamarina CBS 119918 TaxID=1182545 RepID=A0A072PCL8_9EURO|nr:uncharacterized protein A1O9_10728 [Exophiala aquamarina CBS 119918]KEF53280.1 hypothetical protein A1O9_10728 [Exophiala aquamarina CBS 119918]